MGEGVVGEPDALAARVGNGATEIGGVPEDECIDDQVKAGGAEGHGLGGAIAKLPEVVEEHGPGECVAAFAFVEVAVRTPAQFWVEQPVAGEDAALVAANFTQGTIERVLLQEGRKRWARALLSS